MTIQRHENCTLMCSMNTEFAVCEAVFALSAFAPPVRRASSSLFRCFLALPNFCRSRTDPFNVSSHQRRVLMASQVAIVLDHRCTEDDGLLWAEVRSCIVETLLEVLHLAWWQGPSAIGASGNGSASTDGTGDPATQVSISFHRITSASGLSTTLPPTLLTDISHIREELQRAFQCAPTIVGNSDVCFGDFAAAAQVDAIRRICTSQMAGASSPNIILVSTLFSLEAFAQRQLEIPSLISADVSSPRCTPPILRVFAVDPKARVPAVVNTAPLASVLKVPQHSLSVLRAEFQRWMARVCRDMFMPDAAPVMLHIGVQEPIRCAAACAVLSSMSRLSVSSSCVPPTAAVRGDAVVDNLYAFPPQSSLASSAGGHMRSNQVCGVAGCGSISAASIAPVSSALHVERLIQRADVDESWFWGESWHVSLTNEHYPSAAAPQHRCAALWSTLVELCRRSDAVLLLTTSSALLQPSHTLPVRTQFCIGLFSSGGTKAPPIILLRFLVPRENLRCCCSSMRQVTTTAPFDEALLEQLRSQLSFDLSRESSHCGRDGDEVVTHVEHHGAMVALSRLMTSHRRLAVHDTSTSSSMLASRSKAPSNKRDRMGLLLH